MILSRTIWKNTSKSMPRKQWQRKPKETTKCTKSRIGVCTGLSNVLVSWSFLHCATAVLSCWTCIRCMNNNMASNSRVHSNPHGSMEWRVPRPRHPIEVWTWSTDADTCNKHLHNQIQHCDVANWFPQKPLVLFHTAAHSFPVNDFRLSNAHERRNCRYRHANRSLYGRCTVNLTFKRWVVFFPSQGVAVLYLSPRKENIHAHQPKNFFFVFGLKWEHRKKKKITWKHEKQNPNRYMPQVQRKLETNGKEMMTPVMTKRWICLDGRTTKHCLKLLLCATSCFQEQQINDVCVCVSFLLFSLCVH